MPLAIQLLTMISVDKRAFANITAFESANIMDTATIAFVLLFKILLQKYIMVFLSYIL